jgi:hypothetical protein
MALLLDVYFTDAESEEIPDFYMTAKDSKSSFLTSPMMS